MDMRAIAMANKNTLNLANIANQPYITEKAKTVDVNNALALKANQSDLVNTNASLAEKAKQSDLVTQAARINNLVATPNASFYQKSSSGTTGALLVVSSGATTGQINLANVTPVATGYTPVAGDYVLFVYGVASGSAELIDGRTGLSGTVYNSIGNAVRGQITDTNNDISDINSHLFNPFVWTLGGISISTDKHYSIIANNTRASLIDFQITKPITISVNGNFQAYIYSINQGRTTSTTVNWFSGEYKLTDTTLIYGICIRYTDSRDLTTYIRSAKSYVYGYYDDNLLALMKLPSSINILQNYVSTIQKDIAKYPDNIKSIKCGYNTGTTDQNTGTISNTTNTNRITTQLMPVIPGNLIYSNLYDYTKTIYGNQIFIFFDVNGNWKCYKSQTSNYCVVPNDCYYIIQNITVSDLNVNLSYKDYVIGVVNFKNSNCDIIVENILYKFQDGTVDTASDNVMSISFNVPECSVLKTNIVSNWGFILYNKDSSGVKTYKGYTIVSNGELNIPKGVNYVTKNTFSGTALTTDLTTLFVRITVPTKISQLDNDINYVRSCDVNKFINSNVFENGTTVKVYDFYNASKTHSQIIKDALAFASGNNNKKIIFDTINWNIDEAILLDSNTTVIIDGVTIKQNNQVFDNVFRGNNLTIDTNNPYGFPISVSEIENIKILGKNGAKVIGCDVNKTGYNTIKAINQDMTNDSWGWRTLQISLSRCKGLEISGIEFTKPRCWTMGFDRCEYGYIHNITVTSTLLNGDAIDLRVGCKHFRVENINGSTADDTIACSAINMGTTYPVSAYMYPMEPASYLNDTDTIENMSIDDVIIKNINTSGTIHGVICLANGGLQVKNVYIDGVEDIVTSSRDAQVKLYSGYGTGYNDGDINNIKINNIISNGAKCAFECNAHVFNVWCNNLKQNNVGKSLTNITYQDSITITNS